MLDRSTLGIWRRRGGLNAEWVRLVKAGADEPPGRVGDRRDARASLGRRNAGGGTDGQVWRRPPLLVPASLARRPDRQVAQPIRQGARAGSAGAPQGRALHL